MSASQTSETQKACVHLLVLDTLADWEAGLAVAHINRPAPGYTGRYEIRSVGLDRAPIRSIGGVTMTPDMALADLRPSDSAMLILPGCQRASLQRRWKLPPLRRIK